MNSGLQHKMLNYEVTPPENTWNKIAAALDESNLADKFPGTLYNLEVTPPVTSWNQISASLNAENADQPTIANEPRKIFSTLRYAAAAAIIGLIAFGSIKFFISKSDGKEIVKNPVAVKDSLIPAAQGNIKQQDNNLPVPEDLRDEAALEESKHTLARLDVTETRRIKQKILLEPVDIMNEEASPEMVQPSFASGEAISDMASRYIMLMTPEGNIIRMSKKWSNLLCCVSGEEQDEDCKDQLKIWREKIVNSSAAPSSGNFMDILSLVNSLQDK